MRKMAEYIDKSDTETVFREVRKRLSAKKKDYVAIEFLIRDQMLSAAEEIIHAIPAADVVEVVRGKWELDSDPGEPWRYVCNICGEKTKDTVMGKPRASFCPNCGADMRGVTDEES